MKPTRKDLKPGMLVLFVQKKHQASGELTEGIIKSILTSAPSHPHGIKIMTVDKLVGRVVEIVDGEAD
ncbi:YwbE family protein [Fluviicola sp.]|uniref:YwbE family protein n=1 Tax=Fluviicola sp. TaxID=1917219 RepID=UPI000F5CC837|nr:YwbE family protein [Fluviicola sp.]